MRLKTKRYMSAKSNESFGTTKGENEARGAEGRKRVAAGRGSVAVRFYESRLRGVGLFQRSILAKGEGGGRPPGRKSML